jgi:hypothetical protein
MWKITEIVNEDSVIAINLLSMNIVPNPKNGVCIHIVPGTTKRKVTSSVLKGVWPLLVSAGADEVIRIFHRFLSKLYL